MAMGEKYRVYTDHQYGGDSRYVRIYKKDYTGSVTEPIGGETPARLEYPGADNDIFDPIYGSEITVSIVSLTSEQYIEFATAKNKEYLAQVYNVDQTLVEWQGWLIPQEYEEPYNQAPYETTLIFNCGLGLLIDIDFMDTDGSYYQGRQTEILVLAAIMQKIYPSSLDTAFKPYFTTCIGLWEAGQSSSIGSNSLNQSYIDQEKYINDDGSVWNCLDVVKDILSSYGARISMGRSGRWWIMRIRDYHLFYDSYQIHYVDYTDLGAYSAYGAFTSSALMFTLTGIEDRSTMIGWIGGNQIVRHERAYKAVKITLNHFYTNILKAGDFMFSNWDDFWTTSGTVTRVQTGKDLNSYAVKIATASYIQQTFNIDGTGTSPYQILVLSFEAMVSHDEAYTTLAFSLQVTRDAPVAQYLVGQIGGASPSVPGWQAGSGYLYFTNDDGLPSTDEWQSYELIIPYFPADASVVFTVGFVGTAGSGTVYGVYYRNIKLLGTYGGEPPDKTTILQTTISDDNINNLKDLELNLSDIILSGDEGIYFRGAKTIDSDGLTPTAVWNSYRYNSGSRTAIGPEMSLLEYIKSGMMDQYGVNRKRLNGDMNLNTTRWGVMALNIDSIIYIPTMASIDFKRGEVRLSMVQLPESEGIGENLILSWTNVTFDSFSSTDEVITSLSSTGSGKYADADDAISYYNNESFLITIAGTFTDYQFNLQFAGANSALYAGMATIVTTSSASSSTPRLIQGVAGATTMTDVTITLQRVYGY